MNTTSCSRRDLVLGAIAVAAAAPLFPRRLAAHEKTWTVGVIGDTDRGGYGHGLDTVWLGLPETKITGLADPVDGGRARAIERLQLSPDAAFPDYREMLARTRPDLVAVCPRHIDQHKYMILAAIESGAKGIYVEKPFCRDLAEADAIVAACEKTRTKIALAHRNRSHPALPVVAGMVRDGAIGRWLEIRARGKEDARGGSLDLWVLGSHLLNLALFLTGPGRSVSATVLQDARPVVASDVKPGAEGVGPLAGNEIHARFEMENGIPFFFDSVAGAGVRESGFGLQLIGTEGLIDLRADTEPFAQYLEGSPFRPRSESKGWIPISSAGPGLPEPITDLQSRVAGHRDAVRDLLAAITEDRPTMCSEHDGREILELTMGVFESHRRGGARVELPLAERGNPLTKL